MSILYKPNDVWDEGIQPRDGVAYTLEELQDYVGGSFEVVPTVDGGLLLVNEGGLSLDLERNEEASMVAGQEIVGHALYIPDEERSTFE